MSQLPLIARRFSFVLIAALAVGGISSASYAATSVHQSADQKYPMAAADFRQRVSAREEKARAKMEDHITKKALAKDKADELRGRFHDALAKIDAKVDQVCADGTVTKEEAEAVHDLSRSLLHHGPKRR